MVDAKLYRTYIEDYLQRNSIEINYKKNPPVFRCLQPEHIDKNPSAILYSDHIFCPVCSKSYDIFEVAGILNNTKVFMEQARFIEDCLSLKPTSFGNNKKTISTPLQIEEARLFYNSTSLQGKSNNKNNWGKLIKVWPYKNKDGYISCIDVRYESNGKKTIINFWNDNGKLSYTNSPSAIYGLFEAYQNPEKLILINEGCKAAEAAIVLTEFVPISWNRGTSNAKYIDWSILKNRQGFIFPDDDDPGMKAAIEIQKQLPQLKVVQPIEAARKIKPKGADMVEVLQVLSIEEITSHIKNVTYVPPAAEDIQQHLPESQGAFEYPFRILGIGDDNRAYFVGRHRRLVVSTLDALNQNKLNLLAPMSFWINEFSFRNKVQWGDAIDVIIEQAGAIDFDTDNIRGRGAWREASGKICHHDGENTIGEIDDRRLYLRKTKTSIASTSLCKPLMSPKIYMEIAETIKQMSFEKELDAIRCMAWACLSPFAGALPWRPAILLTGDSGSGKTTVVDYVVKKISCGRVFSGAETTSAGLRQFLNFDSTAIILEEAECDTPKKKQNRDDLFSLMRQSTSDDAPNIVKGSRDGHAVSFKMKNMFMFIAISPEIESVADDNRVFRVNMVNPNRNNWFDIQKKLKKIMTPENCESIRSLVWQKLQTILNKTNTLTSVFQEITKKDIRTCFAEGLIFSCYYNIFYPDKPENEIKIELKKLFEFDDFQKRNETEEILDRLLDESIFLSESKTKKTLRYILQEIAIGTNTKQDEYQEAAGQHGLDIDVDGNIYIATNHHEIMKIIQKGKGYQRFFWRHPNLVDKNIVKHIAGKSRRCVMIANVIDIENKKFGEVLPFAKQEVISF